MACNHCGRNQVPQERKHLVLCILHLSSQHVGWVLYAWPCNHFRPRGTQDAWKTKITGWHQGLNSVLLRLVTMRTLEMIYIWCHQVSPKITGLPPKLRIGFAPSSCPHFASREVAPGDLAPQLNGTSEPWRLLSCNPFNERRCQQILRVYNNAPTKSWSNSIHVQMELVQHLKSLKQVPTSVPNLALWKWDVNWGLDRAESPHCDLPRSFFSLDLEIHHRMAWTVSHTVTR